MTRITCLLATLLALGVAAHAGPIDAKVREIYARVIAIPTQTGNGRMPVQSFFQRLEMWHLLVKDLAGTGKAAR